MSAPQHAVAQKLRISVEQLKTRQESGEPVTALDARNDQAWETSPVKMRGAIRIPTTDWRIDPAWPKDQLTVVY